MDMSHTPEVPEADELERDRAERLAVRHPVAPTGGYFGAGTIAQRMRTVIGAQTLLAIGNGLLAGAVLMSVSGAPGWVFVVLAVLTLGAGGVAWFARQMIQEDIVRPLQSASASAVQLAEGNHDVDVENAHRQDEIGDIARALQTIKKAAYKFQKLQAQTESDRQGHFDTLRKLTEGFEKNVSEIVGSVASASSELQATATAMAASAEQSASQSSRVSQSLSEATAGVTAAAAASDEFAMSIGEISRQASTSAELARKASNAAVDADSPLDGYAPVRDHVKDVLKKAIPTGDDPAVVARVVVNAATSRAPKVRYPAGPLARRLALLKRIAPSALLDSGIRRANKLGSAPQSHQVAQIAR